MAVAMDLPDFNSPVGRFDLKISKILMFFLICQLLLKKTHKKRNTVFTHVIKGLLRKDWL